MLLRFGDLLVDLRIAARLPSLERCRETGYLGTRGFLPDCDLEGSAVSSRPWVNQIEVTEGVLHFLTAFLEGSGGISSLPRRELSE
jgi:hypothetical protein